MKKLITILALAAAVGSPAVAKTYVRHNPMNAYNAVPQSEQGQYGDTGNYNSYRGQDPDLNVQLDLRRDNYRE